MVDYKKYLEEIADSSTFSIEELEKMYAIAMEKSLKVHPKGTLDDDKRAAFVLLLVTGEDAVAKQMKSRGQKWVGYVIGVDQIRDQYNFFRSESALEQEKTKIDENTGKLVFIDFDWRMNKEVPEPGTLESKQRSLYMIAKREKESSELYRPVILQMRAEHASIVPDFVNDAGKIRQFVFLASGGNKDVKEKCYVNSVKATDLVKTGKIIEDFAAFAKGTLKPNLRKFKSLIESQIDESLRGASLPVFITKATVAKISPGSTNNDLVALMPTIDEFSEEMLSSEGEMIITAFMNKALPKKFGEQSEIYPVVSKFATDDSDVYMLLGYHVEKSTVPNTISPPPADDKKDEQPKEEKKEEKKVETSGTSEEEEAW